MLTIPIFRTVPVQLTEFRRLSICCQSRICYSDSLNWPPSGMQGANILVDNKGVIKLADFGASKKLADLVSSLPFERPLEKNRTGFVFPASLHANFVGMIVTQGPRMLSTV